MKVTHVSSSKRILITFARSFLTLELARQLQESGHVIYAADSQKTPLASLSNAVEKSFYVPSPRFHPQEYVDALKEIVVKEKIDLLIPVYEEIACLSKALAAFPKSCKIFCPSFDVYNQLQHKWLFQEKLKSLNFPVLKTFLIENAEGFYQHKLNEYALKPCHSRASQFVRKMSASSTIPNITIDPHNPWVAQEWAEGVKFCSYSICNDGRVNAHAVYPVTYAINGNSCIVFEAVAHKKIYDWVVEFVGKINFTGQIAFDFIEKGDGSLFAIECNPRATSGLLLFNSKDGIDQAFFKTQSTPIFPSVGTRKQVALGMLMYGWRRSAIQNNSIRKFASTFLSTQDVIFRMKDIKPFIFKSLIFTRLWLNSRKLGISMPDFYTHDHDWNGKSLESVK